ncbi:transposase [Paenibacillus elgii]|uniref:transposase n=1 Tax=Paenibacillus elgii TaxID=189691 RepID=UPI0026EC70AB|nr:transposase [Paenibacillus elgii]
MYAIPEFAIISNIQHFRWRSCHEHRDITGMLNEIDKRSHGYKRRQEAYLTAPQVIEAMLNRALQAGISASYVLMDSWFTHATLIQEVLRRGLPVIGMVKNDNKRYLVNGDSA